MQGNNLSIKTRNNRKFNFLFLNAGDAARIRAWVSSSRYIRVDSQID
jgi:hypothetical protein